MTVAHGQAESGGGTADTIGTVGFLYPGHSAEDDYPLLERLIAGSGPPVSPHHPQPRRCAPQYGLRVRLPVVHTDIGEDAHRIDALLEMGSAARLAAGARKLADHGAQAVVWACTSASFVFGWHGARQQVRELSDAAGIPASSTSFAFAHAVQALGIRRVAVAATYPEDVAEHFTTFLKDSGVEIVSTLGSGIITAAEVGTWGRAEVLALARDGDHPQAEAVLLPDTALHTAAYLTDLEAEIGKPVLTANQVTVWEGLQLLGPDPAGNSEQALGLDTACAGLGTLFSAATRS